MVRNLALNSSGMEKNKKYKICFVCTGNACRSPFAEWVMRSLLQQEGIEEVDVFSVGTYDWGKNPRDEFMVSVAEKMGYELTGTTTHMTRKALLEADRIIVFEKQHRNAITKVLDYARWDRIVLFNQFAFGKETSMEDPRCQTLAVYQRVAMQIETGCKNILEKLKKEVDGEVKTKKESCAVVERPIGTSTVVS